MRSIDSSILTHSGIYFDLLDPKPADVSILDIARALSHLCRYTGHTRTHYSVAEHCVRMSHLVTPQRAFAALLHDAAEAYVGDVARPLKRLLPHYISIEHRVQAAVFRAFGLDDWLPRQVQDADRYMLAWERRDLMPEQAMEWPACRGVTLEAAPVIVPWSADEAMERYLDRFHELFDAKTIAPEAAPCAA